MENLDSYLDSYTLPTPLNVFRVVKTEFIEDLEIGQIFTAPAYMSTTVLSSAVEGLKNTFKARSVLNLTIHVNAGVYLGNFRVHNEYEFLLKRGTSFKITGKETDQNGNITLWGELLDE